MSDIEDVKQRLDIVEVISGYLPLQKSGRNFKALCPFHAEKMPSFYVFPERQSWHCFGACGTGGDVLAFVMKKENVDFAEALRMLAQRAGVTLKRDSERGVDKEQKKRLEELNSIVAAYYHKLLLQSPEAELARRYLLKRGLSEQGIKDFQLGFSSGSRDGLRRYLVGIGCEENDLVSAGLVGKSDDGDVYDRFRNRLMFPIRDARGAVLGFGARALDDSHPKYLNSPQTLLFDKSGILYGLDRAKEGIRQQDQVVIVEGYMDVIAAHEHGFNNVVASMGTALTERQVGSLKRLSRNIAFALDADMAGEAATQRGIETTAEVLDQRVIPIPTARGAIRFENVLDAEVRVIELPSDSDPDQIIREDSQKWQTLVEDALPVIDHAFRRVASGLDLTKPIDKSKAVKQLQPLIEDVKDPVRRGHYELKLANLVGVKESAITDALRAQRGAAKSRNRGKTYPFTESSISEGDSWEEYCLSLLLQYPELHSHVGELSSEYFQRTENRQVFLALARSPSDELLQEELDVALKEHLSVLMARPIPPMTVEIAEEALEASVRSLRERWLVVKAKENSVLLSEAQLSGNAAEVTQGLQQSAVEVSAQLREVFELRKRRKPESTA
jgi:DNA primase